MKLTITDLRGRTIEFEGSPAEFDHIRDLLIPPAPAPSASAPAAGAMADGDGAGRVPPPTSHVISQAELRAALDRADARSDLHAATVMTWLLTRAGMKVTSAEIKHMFEMAGRNIPASPAAPLHNAKQRRLVERNPDGSWSPTAMGKAYARGDRDAVRQLALSGGEGSESD